VNAPTPRLLITLLLAALASGCVKRSAIDSNKAGDYTAQPHRMLIITAMGPELQPEHYKIFSDKLLARIQECGTTTELVTRSGLELDKTALVNTIQAFNPDATLNVVETSYAQTGGYINQINYMLRIDDVASQRTVWKAQVALQPAYTAIALEPAGAVLAMVIAQRLETDRILLACPTH
jgi:hypothetical protein